MTTVNDGVKNKENRSTVVFSKFMMSSSQCDIRSSEQQNCYDKILKYNILNFPTCHRISIRRMLKDLFDFLFTHHPSNYNFRKIKVSSESKNEYTPLFWKRIFRLSHENSRLPLLQIWRYHCTPKEKYGFLAKYVPAFVRVAMSPKAHFAHVAAGKSSFPDQIWNLAP